MAAVFLYCQCRIQPRLICRGGKRLRQRQAVFIVRAAEDPKRNVLLPKRLQNGRLVLLQDRNPRALQNQKIAARGGKRDGAQQHIAPGRKAAARDFFVALALHGIQGVCDRKEGCVIVAPAERSVSVRLGALDGLQLPAVALCQYGSPIHPRRLCVLRVAVDGKEQPVGRFPVFLL